jgi:hypothetical protein
LISPDEEQSEEESLRYGYSALQTHFFFGYEGEARLHLIETVNSESRLWGTGVIGRTITDVVALACEKGLTTNEVVDYGDGECLYIYPGCNIYAESGVVSSVQITVFFDDEGEVQWPGEEKVTV